MRGASFVRAPCRYPASRGGAPTRITPNTHPRPCTFPATPPLPPPGAADCRGAGWAGGGSSSDGRAPARGGGVRRLPRCGVLKKIDIKIKKLLNFISRVGTRWRSYVCAGLKQKNFENKNYFVLAASARGGGVRRLSRCAGTGGGGCGRRSEPGAGRAAAGPIPSAARAANEKFADSKKLRSSHICVASWNPCVSRKLYIYNIVRAFFVTCSLAWVDSVDSATRMRAPGDRPGWTRMRTSRSARMKGAHRRPGRRTWRATRAGEGERVGGATGMGDRAGPAGMAVPGDEDLLWIAEMALTAPLPAG